MSDADMPIVLLDERRAPSFRSFLMPVLARGTAADFAVTRVRLAAVDLDPAQLAGLARCRLLLGRVDAQTLADAERDAASQRAYARRLHGLRALLNAGTVQVRAAGTDAWSPDFSVIYDGQARAPAPAIALLGAHYFARPFPIGGPALTCVLRDPGAAAGLAARFEELWSRGYDIRVVIDDALARMTPAEGTALGVQERRARYRPGRARTATMPDGLGSDTGVGSRTTRGKLAAEGSERGDRSVRPAEGASGSNAGDPAGAAAVLHRMLIARFGPPTGDESAPGQGEPPLFDLAEFQQEAVARAARALATWRGVIVADAVGLGKTYVALALVERALRAGRRVAVIAPAALRAGWAGPLRKLRDACGCASRGLGRAQGIGARGARGGSVAWLTHTALGRGLHRPEHLLPLDLVIVDEAHAFRSSRTRRYRALADLCREARVALLTATPVNNTPEDLVSLLRLFAADGAFRELGVPSLAEAFASDAAGGPQEPAMARVLERVMIRRTRPFVRDRHGGVLLPDGRRLTFPRRAPPTPVRYTLDDALPGFAAQVAARAEALTFAPLRLAAYGDASPARPGVGDLLRVHLLKRLESSLAAFETTLQRQVRFLEAFLDALHRGRLLSTREHAGLHNGDKDAVQLSLDAVVLRPIPPRLDLEALDGDVAADLHALRALARQLPVPAGADPKLATLTELLDGPLAGEKVLLFTEFRDTARQLWRALADRGRVGLIDGGSAFLGRSPAGRREIIERFAPHANRRPAPRARERVDLLIATDVLSEGLNLQDARRVISYDLPWNPVRLMQRIGRVDRLGSPHETVFSYHFLPEQDLDRALRLLDRLQRKIADIGRTVGGERSPLTGANANGAVSRPTSLIDRLAAGDPDVLDEIERADAAPFEAEERLRAAWRQLGATMLTERARTAPRDSAVDREAPDRHQVAAEKLAGAAAASLSLKGPHRLLLAFTHRGEHRWLVYDVADARIDADPRAADQLAAAALTWAPSAGTHHGLARAPAAARSSGVAPTLVSAAVAAGLRVLQSEHYARRAAVQRANSPASRASRRVLALLAKSPGGPAAALCARADAALHALERIREARTEDALEVLLRRSDLAPGATPLLAEIEVVLARDAGAGLSETDREAEPRLVGALELLPPYTAGNASAKSNSSPQFELSRAPALRPPTTP